MKAMQLQRLGAVQVGSTPLKLIELQQPRPAEGEVLIQVQVCGVCHTELDEIEGRTPPSTLPLVLGHQVVGRVVELGSGVSKGPAIGQRVGVAWIYSACGRCICCQSGRENLCADFRATGRDANGGYAEYITAPAAFVVNIPEQIQDIEAAPLLCAGAIGYRSLRLANFRDGQRLGLTGFGASAHLVLKMVRHRFPASAVYVFARNETERAFARELGAVWTGESLAPAPAPLDAIIDTTPAWSPILGGLANLAPGGRLIVNAIRKEETDKSALLELDYPRHLWLEKEIKSVANVTRADVQEFLNLAAEMQLRPHVQTYPLTAANEALVDLKTRAVTGAKVLLVRDAA